MRSLLFHATPSDDPDVWENFVCETSELELPLGAEQLAPNIWLFPRDSRFDLTLGRIGRQNGIACRCAAITHKSEWARLP